MARRRKKSRSPIVIVIFIIIAAIGFFAYQYGDKLLPELPSPSFDTEPTTTSAPTPPVVVSGDEVTYHVIDVGQADAILIMSGGKNMLIDSGDLSTRSRDKLVDYLEKYNVNEFEYVVFTHTDADHIGNGDYVLLNYEVETVIMPDYEATTKVYTKLVDAIANQGVDLVLIGEDTGACEQAGYTFKLGEVVNTVMGPTEDFNDANEMSVVIKSVYGEVSVMLTGDAEGGSEAAMLEKYKNGELDCDILKVGHHGAYTSTTQEFLDAVSPEVALISCGYKNTYEHPHDVTMDKLNAAKLAIYRTDLQGSIVVKTDGETYTVTTEK